MIPLRLVLNNFLSYREATLNFQGLHTACICGANGAGKSSLLEAIAWAIWGESRATSEDDVVHLGAAEALVDFTFIHNHHTYRILRSRQRSLSTTLEFQVALNAAPTTALQPSTLQFRSLTAKGVRATQQVILDHLRLDYETFVNSAYLRQGRADEFMLKRPNERKQILADLLKLAQYDELAERARDQSRQLKGQIELLERNLVQIQAQLQQHDTIAQQRSQLESTLAHTQQQQTLDTAQLQTLQETQHQRQTWQQQLSWQQQQQRVLEQDCHRLQQELSAAQHQQQELVNWLQQEDVITQGYAQFQALQTQEAQFSVRFKTHQLAQAQRQQYLQQQAEQATTLQTSIQHLQAQLDALQQQEEDIQHTLRKATTIEDALTSLQHARSQLSQLDQLQLQVAPLLQRRQQLQTQLDHNQARLSARLDELLASSRQLQRQQARQPDLQVAVLEVSDRIQTLEQRHAYQQQVREKGLERRNFMERLQIEQRNYEAQLADVEQKIELLQQHIEDADLNVLLPPCPLCDHPLDAHHRTVVLTKHQEKREEILNQLWVIREQLSTSEREIQILRQEYRELERELHQYPTELERRGQLQEQLQAIIGVQQTLSQMTTEMTAIERSLQQGEYASDLQAELSLIDQRLQELNYDEKNHALARGDVDRWRWAEIKQAEIKQAQRRQQQIAQRQPELQTQLEAAQTALNQLHQATTAQLQTFDQHIADIGYHLDQHNTLQEAIRTEQVWQLRYQEFIRAQQHYPRMQQRVQELSQSLKERQLALQLHQGQTQTLLQNLQHTPDLQKQIVELEQRLQARRTELDEQLATLGRLQQQQQQLDSLGTQHTTLTAELKTLQRQYRVYHELAQAFGKNGIQALMIETVLPQLEAEANRILSRLSANQHHIQFITQRSHKRSPSRTKAKLEPTKFIETLDIVIADTQGTRPYETYSGGEAFRVNFAIRLALARLLAQRSGTALQMLIVDEGFGTQDSEGCDRLIAAINAIAADFACILTVTHVPHFKEAFQARIEVLKTQDGSQLQLMM